MNKTQTAILIIVAVVLLGLLVYVGVNQQSPEDGETLPGEENEEAIENGEEAGPVGESEVEGGSPVDEEGRVVTEEGEPVDQAAEPGSPEAPRQTAPITEEDVPDTAMKVSVSASGFDPNEFTVRRGAAVTLSVTATDEQTHIFKFSDPSLKGVAVGVGPGETRAITFNAPDERGTYEYFCDVPGHAGRGETGTMIVE
jgi:plastocyanin